MIALDAGVELVRHAIHAYETSHDVHCELIKRQVHAHFMDSFRCSFVIQFRQTTIPLVLNMRLWFHCHVFAQTPSTKAFFFSSGTELFHVTVPTRKLRRIYLHKVPLEHFSWLHRSVRQHPQNVRYFLCLGHRRSTRRRERALAQAHNGNHVQQLRDRSYIPSCV